MSSEASQEVVVEFLEALQSNDMATVQRLFTEEATMTIHSNLQKPFGGTFRGRQEILEGFRQRLMQLMPDGEHFEQGILVSGDSNVAVEWTKRATTTKTIHQNYTTLFDIRDGKIQAAQVYVDT